MNPERCGALIFQPTQVPERIGHAGAFPINSLITAPIRPMLLHDVTPGRRLDPQFPVSRPNPSGAEHLTFFQRLLHRGVMARARTPIVLQVPGHARAGRLDHRIGVLHGYSRQELSHLPTAPGQGSPTALLAPDQVVTHPVTVAPPGKIAVLLLTTVATVLTEHLSHHPTFPKGRAQAQSAVDQAHRLLGLFHHRPWALLVAQPEKRIIRGSCQRTHPHLVAPGHPPAPPVRVILYPLRLQVRRPDHLQAQPLRSLGIHHFHSSAGTGPDMATRFQRRCRRATAPSPTAIDRM